MHLKKILVFVLVIFIGGIFYNNRHYLNKIISFNFEEKIQLIKSPDSSVPNKNDFNYQQVKSPYIVITSDTHISAPEGRWPHTTERFQHFIQKLATNPPDLVFIVGDIIDNTMNTKLGPLSGNSEHWEKEVDLYHSLVDSVSPIPFLQTLGPGHDYGNLTLAEKALGSRRGLYRWRGFQLIWITVNSVSYSTTDTNHTNALTDVDYLWLTKQLEISTNVILLFHVPLRTDITFEAGKWPNNRNLTIDSRDPLYKIIDKFSDKIAAIFNGHIHHPIQTKYRNIPLYICPFLETGCHCILTDRNNLLNVQYIDCLDILH